MTGIQRTLLAIALLVICAVSLFIWFIVNWDSSKTQPIGHTTPAASHEGTA